MYLKGKTILVVSPQEWSDFYISKHNYAIELAALGNQVIFLNPPQKGKSWKGQWLNTSFKGLKVLEYSTFFPNKIRFHSYLLYSLLMRSQLQFIRRKIAANIDVLWCFEPNVFPSLNWFNARTKIYHPVDFLTNERQVNLGKNADIIFSVADNILQLFNHLTVPKYFINHGLSSYYSTSEIQPTVTSDERPLKFAYIGSLFIPGLDRASLRRVIEIHPDIEFDFYGRYEREKNVSEEMRVFIDFLSTAANVRLKGVLHPKELSQHLKKYHGFLLCYNPSKELNSGSNSHKMLEYLSFGKVIVSSKINAYEHLDQEVLMSKKEDNSDYVALFDEAVKNIHVYNDSTLSKKRRAISMDNTYMAQIQKIDNILCKQL